MFYSTKARTRSNCSRSREQFPSVCLFHRKSGYFSVKSVSKSNVTSEPTAFRGRSLAVYEWEIKIAFVSLLMQAWHAWAYMNFEAVLYYKNQQSGNDGNGDGSICRTPLTPSQQNSSVS